MKRRLIALMPLWQLNAQSTLFPPLSNHIQCFIAS